MWDKFRPPSRQYLCKTLKRGSLRWKLSVGFCFCLSGIALLGISLFATLFLQYFIEESIISFVVIDSTHHHRYDDWEDNTREDSVPLFVDVYFWNLSNLEDISNDSSVKPSFNKMGPFSYRKYYKKINVSFSDDGNKVSYDRWTYFVYDGARSVSDPKNTVITGVNNGYLGAMASLGDESALPSAITPKQISGLKVMLTERYARGIVAGTDLAMSLPAHLDQLLEYIGNISNVSKTEAFQVFCSEWPMKNTTHEPKDSPWATFGALGDFLNTGKEVSKSTAEQLFSTQAYYSLLSTNDSVLLAWDASSAGAPAQLFSALNISEDQFHLIAKWRDVYLKVNVEHSLLARYKVSSVGDIGYLQWGTGSVLSNSTLPTNQSMLEAYPALELVAIPEIAVWSEKTTRVTFDVSQSKFLLAQLSSPVYYNTFMKYYRLDMKQEIEQLLNITSAEVNPVFYYTYHIANTFSTARLHQVFKEGGSLFPSRTAYQWIWGIKDPLLVELSSPNPVVKLMDNVTSIQEAESKANVSLYYTGKSDVDKVAKLIEWRGMGALPAGVNWPVDVPIRGTSGTQFHPFIEEKDDVVFFSEDLMRPFEVEYSRRVTKNGITLYRYHPSPRDFDPNPDFNQYIPGFANMSMTYSGVPFFLSQPNFLNVPNEYRNLIAGMNPDPVNDDTYLDIEPITGAVMDASKKLQVNMYIKNDTQPLNKYNKNIPKGRFYPTLYIDETAAINDKLADDFKSSVYFIVDLRKGFFWSFFILGALALVIGVLVNVYVWLRYRTLSRMRYDVLGEETPVLEDYDQEDEEEEEEEEEQYGVG